MRLRFASCQCLSEFAASDSDSSHCRNRSLTLEVEESALRSIGEELFLPFMTNWVKSVSMDPSQDDLKGMRKYWSEQVVPWGAAPFKELLSPINGFLNMGHYCCAQFVVSRNRIRSRPVELYKALEKYVLDSLDDHRTTRELEQTW